MNNEVIALILGGGRGRGLFPLTRHRSKPAVPIGGKHRLIDIPISNCLHADIRRIFVLTQFNSASLNRHISHTYRMDVFSRGFVEILAAEQTPDNPHWFQGTADAVRQAARHVVRHDAQYYLVLAGDHLYRMDFGQMIDMHIDRQADITIAAQSVSAQDASALEILRFDRGGEIAAFEYRPAAERLREIGRSIPSGSVLTGHNPDKPFVASMGVYVFSKEVLVELLSESSARHFAREILPSALGRYQMSPYLFRGYWADVGSIASFYDVNVRLTRPGAPFRFYDAHRPIYTHPRFLPGSRLNECSVRHAVVAEGCYLDRCRIEESVVSIRTIVRGGASVRRSVLLGADFYEPDDEAPRGGTPRLGIGEDVELDRVIVDKNARIGNGARLTNEGGLREADGEGYYIRDGIIIVPKDGVIRPGTLV